MMPDKQNSIICPELVGAPPCGGNKFTGWLGRVLMRLTGWSFQGQLPHYRKMVIGVAPHTSNWDFFLGVAVLFALRIRIRFLGKHTIFVPVVKQLLQSIGGIPVDRRSTHGVVGQVVDEFERRQEMILAVAPEGTRSPIFPWKTGFLAIAESARVPVVLIGFDFKLKKIIFGPILPPDISFADKMHMVYEFFATVHAKYPHNVRFPE
ncbi:1-acyl-sn-glycerol-3-phosphate acyltransferase [Alteromonas flava]|uniref:1-acyl-sn-glycerol-3-phosphate acyltransferase n=1 Tax=Alteromonas flava TaxID=2048003 RepID=UPI001F0CB221|nr:1-acyl-sn-glycerol-3-phosphate acyltransferase [Alteromonas flava]